MEYFGLFIGHTLLFLLPGGCSMLFGNVNTPHTSSAFATSQLIQQMSSHLLVCALCNSQLDFLSKCAQKGDGNPACDRMHAIPEESEAFCDIYFLNALWFDEKRVLLTLRALNRCPQP